MEALFLITMQLCVCLIKSPSQVKFSTFTLFFQIESRGRYDISLPHLVIQDKGNYTCVVTNKYGSINMTYHLFVVGTYWAYYLCMCVALLGLYRGL